MTEHHYSTLLFDLGNVVFGTDNGTSIRFWADLKKLDHELIRERYSRDLLHGDFQKGLITPEEYHQHLCDILEIDFTFEEFVEGWNMVYREGFSDVKEEIVRLSGRYTIAAFTNTNEVHNEIWPYRYSEVLSYFDHVYVSSEMKLRKPELEAFHYVLGKLRVEPPSVLFFDDREENIKAASTLGMDCVLVRSSSDVSSKLRSLN